MRTPDTLLANIPWSQLTYIRLHCEAPADQFLNALRQCVQAQYIDIERVKPSSLMPSVPVTLPYLTYLRVVCFTDDIITLLDDFNLPSLRTLKLVTRPLTTSRDVKGLQALAARSSCTLETLHVDDWFLPEEELIAYLSLPCLQSLRKLDIASINISERTLSLLIFPSTTSDVGGILPCLEQLHIGYITNDGLLSDVVGSRRRLTGVQNSPTSLKRVKVIFKRRRGDEPLLHDLDILHFNEFAEQGLSISWSWI
ncbi:hypothetical protein Hypma_010708 [Hypsizygus marmoreus]|uniref:F-box domain-containing protein n=1 Tax=Hypsizygus marmoreus TaxID=39966 RepID=A0A369JLJ9_HYPMA|nr:hypothetical protein Hypma_010708 [Hypsizygus marmoreus]